MAVLSATFHDTAAGTERAGVIRVRLILVAVLVVTAAALSPMLFSLRGEDYGIASQRQAPDFQLQDVQGQGMTLNDFAGQYLFLMFGYLNCPDVCHTQALLFEEIALAASHDSELAFAYIAIDPLRDTPQQIAAYFDARGDNFQSLHGDDPGSLQQIALAYKAFFSRRSPQDPDYLVDHTGLYFLIGPDGQLRYTYAANQNATPRIVADLQRLEREYSTI